MTDRTSRTLLALILLLGAALRLYGLGKQSLWLDELASWQQSSYSTVAEVITKGVGTDFHPPGYQVLLFGVERGLGTTEFDLRLPSALFGIASIALVFFLARYLYSDREGLISAAFVSVLFYPLLFSQTARSYSMLMASSLAATLLWTMMLRHMGIGRPPPRKVLIGYIPLAVICSYTHYFGTYLVLLQAASALLVACRFRTAIWKIGCTYAAVLALYSPWIPGMLGHVGKHSPWIRPLATDAFLSFIYYGFNSAPKLGWVAILLYVSLFATTLIDRRRGRAGVGVRRIGGIAPGLLLVLWLVIPFGGAYLKSILSVPVLSFRNMVISLPALYILLARSITRLPLRGIGQAVVAGGLVCVLLWHLIFGIDFYGPPPRPVEGERAGAFKQQFREAVWYITDREEEYPDSFVIGLTAYRALFDYYFERADSPLRVEAMGGHKGDIERIRGKIEERAPRYVWHIAAHARLAPEFLEAMAADMHEVEHKLFYRAEVRLYERRSD
ncbi:MAG: hypothetical protein CME06_18155 [Gemmatimonadetes bacterium]|nr:hypothetical protein [Gemmatimonadota bacterium]